MNHQTKFSGSREDWDHINQLWKEWKCFHCESLEHMAKDCLDRHNMKPPMTLNSIESMSPNEVQLAALNEGTHLGLFEMNLGNSIYVNTGSMDVCLARCEVLWRLALAKLHNAIPLPFDELDDPDSDPFTRDRFSFSEYGGTDAYLLTDKHNGDSHVLYYLDLADPDFDLLHWLHIEKSRNFDELICAWRSSLDSGYSSDSDDDPFEDEFEDSTDSSNNLDDSNESSEGKMDGPSNFLQISLIETTQSSDQEIQALEQNSSRVKNSDRICLKPVVVVVHIDGQPCCTLLDSGSLSDFMSTTLANQLKLKLELFDKPLPIQLAVSGSQSRVKV
jgi:hypothetical protein